MLMLCHCHPRVTVNPSLSDKCSVIQQNSGIKCVCSHYTSMKLDNTHTSQTMPSTAHTTTGNIQTISCSNSLSHNHPTSDNSPIISDTSHTDCLSQLYTVSDRTSATSWQQASSSSSYVHPAPASATTKPSMSNIGASSVDKLNNYSELSPLVTPKYMNCETGPSTIQLDTSTCTSSYDSDSLDLIIVESFSLCDFSQGSEFTSSCLSQSDTQQCQQPSKCRLDQVAADSLLADEPDDSKLLPLCVPAILESVKLIASSCQRHRQPSWQLSEPISVNDCDPIAAVQITNPLTPDSGGYIDYSESVNSVLNHMLFAVDTYCNTSQHISTPTDIYTRSYFSGANSQLKLEFSGIPARVPIVYDYSSTNSNKVSSDPHFDLDLTLDNPRLIHLAASVSPSELELHHQQLLNLLSLQDGMCVINILYIYPVMFNSEM